MDSSPAENMEAEFLRRWWVMMPLMEKFRSICITEGMGGKFIDDDGFDVLLVR